jgi:DNA-binding PadR family transcriptional regulator
MNDKCNYFPEIVNMPDEILSVKKTEVLILKILEHNKYYNYKIINHFSNLKMNYETIYSSLRNLRTLGFLKLGKRNGLYSITKKGRKYYNEVKSQKN